MPDEDKQSIFLKNKGKTICRCGACCRVTVAANLKPFQFIKDLHERLNEGSEVPAGECDECGGFAYVVDFKEEVEDYLLKGGVRCPLCNSEDLTVSSRSTEDDCVRQPVTCEDCGATWDDVLRLAAVENLEPGEPPARANYHVEEFGEEDYRESV